MSGQDKAQADFVAHCEALIQMRALELSPLEDGRHKAGRDTGAGWQDITADRLFQIKREIEELQTAIAMYRDLSRYAGGPTQQKGGGMSRLEGKGLR